MNIKRIALILFVSVFLFSCSKDNTPTPQQPDKPIVPDDARWKQMDDMTITNSVSAFSFTIGNKGYVLNEEGQAGATLNLWIFDTATGQWGKKAAFPGAAKMGFSGFVLNGKAYVGTGAAPSGGNSVSVANKEFYEYDPAADTWTRKADFPGVARVNTVALAINANGYMGLGVDVLATQKFTDIWKYDVANDTWAKIADYPGDGQYLNKGFAIGSKGYVGMGIAVADRTTPKSDFWQYDPANDTWTKKANFTGVARVLGVNFYVDGSYYVGAGSARNEILRDIWKYNDTTDTWLKVTTYPDEVTYGLIGFAVGNTAYVGGGASYTTGGYTKHFWQIKP